MWFLKLDLTPEPGTQEATAYRGAKAVCFVRVNSGAEAQHEARRRFAQMDWEVTRIEQSSLITRESAKGSEGTKMYDQAEKGGWSCAIAKWEQ